MYNLQAALDERLASLRSKKSSSKHTVTVKAKFSKASIELSLKQAGILDRNGRMVNKVVSKK